MTTEKTRLRTTVFWGVLVVVLFASGCGYARHQFGRPFGALQYEIGKTTRTDILQALGPPQLYDYTRAGEIGANYLVYEHRQTKTWVFNVPPLICLINYIANTEKTNTAAFYFDAKGTLTAVGFNESQPTTSRHGFSVLYPWGLDEVMK